MALGWPWALLAALAVPLLLTARWWLRRRRRTAVTVTSVALIRAALPGGSSWRRRLPVALFAAGLLALAGAAARPQATVTVPRNDTSILLAVDVSGSMCSTDVRPNRLSAAGDAARAFVEASDDGTRIGLVAFSGVAGVLVPPTVERQPLLEAIDGFRTARGTAIGQAILTSIDAIAEHNPDVAPSGVDLGPVSPGGDYQPDTIVVLTDGSNTTGVDPLTAARQAAARHLRVFTIGFGTTDPAPMVCTADQVGEDSFGGRDPAFGGFSGDLGFRRFLQLDERALTEVADTTGGKYFRAEDADRLADVLAGLPAEIGLHEEEVEISVWFVLAGTLLAFAGIFLALWWSRSGSPSGYPRRG